MLCLFKMRWFRELFSKCSAPLVLFSFCAAAENVKTKNLKKNNSKMNKALEIKDLDVKLDGTDVDYYNNAATYWEGVDCTINGMLGGFGKITDIDIDSSNKLLKLLFKVKIILPLSLKYFN